jgi:zinc protease
MADLSAATVDDVKNFFRTYYAPNNATIVITGDFTPAIAKQLVTKYFGPIPRGPAITRPSLKPVTMAAEKRLVLEDTRARLPQIRFAWPTIGNGNPDLLPLQALANWRRVWARGISTWRTRTPVCSRSPSRRVRTPRSPRSNAWWTA